MPATQAFSKGSKALQLPQLCRDSIGFSCVAVDWRMSGRLVSLVVVGFPAGDLHESSCPLGTLSKRT